MDTITVILFAAAAFAIQLAIFIVARRHKKKAIERDEFVKYGIKTRNDAWRLMNDPNLPEKDRAVVERLYNELTANP